MAAHITKTLLISRRKTPPMRVAKRCVAFFVTICVLPVLLVLLVTTDQYMRPQQQRHLLEYEANLSRYGTSIGTGNNNQGPSYVNFTAVEIRMNLRRNHLLNQCFKLGLDVPGNDSIHRPNPWEFLINRDYKLVWCNVFKAASTSWMYNFNLLAGYSPQFLKKTKLVPLTIARKRYPRPSLTELETAVDDSVSFIIVRHPLERLLSAYRDKMQLSLPLTYHQKLGKKIINKYRRKKNDKSLSTRWPTFEEFVRYLLDQYAAGETMDMHWTPITEFCTPCMVHFSVIAKFETLWEDQKYLIHLGHLENVIKPEWKNSVRGKGTVELIPQYFKQLTKAQIYQLHNIYRYDFELFNYTLNGYIEHAIDDPETT